MYNIAKLQYETDKGILFQHMDLSAGYRNASYHYFLHNEYNCGFYPFVEILDYGYPQNTDTGILKTFITQQGVKSQVCVNSASSEIQETRLLETPHIKKTNVEGSVHVSQFMYIICITYALHK